jgi:PAS domain S-box-containing protein
MVDVTKMFGKTKVAIVAADENFNIIFQNERCRELFKERFNRADYIGSNMAQCHKPETMEKMKALYEAYRERKRSLDYAVRDLPRGKAVFVRVPFYDEEKFAGVVEFIFETYLA